MPDPIIVKEKDKSYKREMSGALFAVLFLFFILGIFYPQLTQAAEMLLAPTFVFGGGAFGMDAYAKQIQNRR